ncbi:hypothetical protein ACWDTG_06900 [Rhodococcus zopfii]
MSTSMKGQQLLDALDDAREFEAEVGHAWKHVTVQTPLALGFSIACFAVALYGPLVALAGSAAGLFLACWFIFLFRVHAPREGRWPDEHVVTIRDAAGRTKKAQSKFDAWVREGGVL